MLALYLLSLTLCVISLSQHNNKTLSAVQLKALSNLNVSLGDVQKNIKNAQDALKTIDLSEVSGKNLLTVTNVTEDTLNQPIAPHRKEMDADRKGFLIVGLDRLCESIVLKEPKHLTEIFQYAEDVVPALLNVNRLSWLEEPMLHILQKILRKCMKAPVEELKSYASVLQLTLANRRKTLSNEVNYLIDYAENLVMDPEGDQILKVVNTFRDYPKTTNSGPQICVDIVEAFEMPFLKLGSSSDRKYLVKEANQALKRRYPHLANISQTEPLITERHHQKDTIIRGSHNKQTLKLDHHRKIPNSTQTRGDHDYDSAYLDTSEIKLDLSDDNIDRRRSFHFNEANKQRNIVKHEVKKHNQKNKSTRSEATHSYNNVIKKYIGTTRKMRDDETKYQDVRSDEIVTRKMIENKFRNAKKTTKNPFALAYDAATRKLLDSTEEKANINSDTMRKHNWQKRFDVVDYATQNIQNIDGSYSQLRVRRTTGYAEDFTTTKHKYRLNHHNKDVRRFQTVHTGLKHGNRRSDTVFNYEDKNENNNTPAGKTSEQSVNIDENNSFKDSNEHEDRIAVTPSVRDDIIALKMNVINELINYNHRLFKLMNLS